MRFRYVLPAKIAMPRLTIHRQADWLHRVWVRRVAYVFFPLCSNHLNLKVLLQLIVFSALCAFTSDFDVCLTFDSLKTPDLTMIWLDNIWALWQ